MPFDKSDLWKRVFDKETNSENSEHIDTLVTSLRQIRKQAAYLTNEISNDLKDYTVHDVTHLDALWGVAGQICGNDYSINPLELFVLGGAFLLHDAAMTCAAYPGGIEEIKAHKDWNKTFAKFSNVEDKSQAEELTIKAFLREQHATRAEKLPSIEWETPDGHVSLIEDFEIRQKLGQFIGKISASHWWNHEDLETHLDKVITAPPPFPQDWSIDLLKVACLLRVADAAQIDSRRAPGFLWALRKPYISNYSNMHWNYQTKLTQPECRDDAILYNSTKDFSRSESSEWWMLYDALQMIDGELKKTDALIYNLRGDDHRFKARRVSCIESPKALMSCITVSRWVPVDTAYSISDIPKIVKKLGGEQLYGNNIYAPIREIIQNAMDATRLRNIVDATAASLNLMVEVSIDKKEKSLTISDKGVGLSPKTIVEDLLSFGTSGWFNDDAIGEYSDALLSSGDVAGRYGIGFFSIFMLGDKVKVESVRFDKSPDETVILEFKKGLNERPILYKAEGKNRKLECGTTIKVNLSEDVIREIKFASDSRHQKSFLDVLQSTFPTSDIPMNVDVNGDKFIIDGRQWKTEPSEKLFSRIYGSDYVKNTSYYALTEQALSPIYDDDNNLIGRMSMNRGHDRLSLNRDGIITSKGTAAGKISFSGVVEGQIERASRDLASPSWCKKSLKGWATEQAVFYSSQNLSPEQQIHVAQLVILCEGDSKRLKICETSKGYLTYSEFEKYLNELDQAHLIQDAAISLIRRNLKFELLEGIISCPMGWPAIMRQNFGQTRHNPTLEQSLFQKMTNLIAQKFNIEEDVIKELSRIEDGAEVYTYNVDIGKDEYGNLINDTGHSFFRGMTINDLKNGKYPYSITNKVP